MDLMLNGKEVLITGGSRGIGLSIARVFAREGCALHLNAVDRDRLAKVAQSLRDEYGVRVTVHAGDLTRADIVEALANACGHVDILVNNAGATPTGPIEAMEPEIWRRGFDLKLTATVTLTREIYLAMKARGDGVIVNVIGNCGERPDPEIIVATVTNTGLMGFTKALGAAAARHGVRVLGVNPGPTATDRLVHLMERKLVDRGGKAADWRQLTQHLPMGRAGTPEEIANVVAFAASPLASYVNATILTADGGLAADGHLF